MKIRGLGFWVVFIAAIVMIFYAYEGKFEKQISKEDAINLNQAIKNGDDFKEGKTYYAEIDAVLMDYYTETTYKSMSDGDGIHHYVVMIDDTLLSFGASDEDIASVKKVMASTRKSDYDGKYLHNGIVKFEKYGFVKQFATDSTLGIEYKDKLESVGIELDDNRDYNIIFFELTSNKPFNYINVAIYVIGGAIVLFGIFKAIKDLRSLLYAAKGTVTQPKSKGVVYDPNKNRSAAYDELDEILKAEEEKAREEKYKNKKYR